ncbi:hypothetical protein NGUA11_04029 [Salmonella enterica]|nr:hypothetical protein NGUA11_04029 [Salmonella enterica]
MLLFRFHLFYALFGGAYLVVQLLYDGSYCLIERSHNTCRSVFLRFDDAPNGAL